MTERKPFDIPFETWVERQIREASERGDFDNLPGAGKPIPGLDRPHDEMWWIKEKMRRENLSYLPPTLMLRREATDALEAALAAPSEAQARRILDDINEVIRAVIRRPLSGPPLNLAPFRIERVLAERRARRGEGEPTR
ncbi:MAG: DUF1992 domain-containing protein [Thermomicrobiales bacterium]|nr:DUF1992 domain-containing protein [Thermomicrobiales bacterium]